MLLGLLVGTTVLGATYMIQNVENLNIGGDSLDIPNEITNQISGISEFLGGIFTDNQNDTATTTIDYTTLGNLSIHSNFRQGDDPNIDNNSWTRDYLFKDFTDNTTTPILIENKQGQPIYLQKVGIELTGLPTSTLQMFLGTSTAAGVQGDSATQCAITDPDDRLAALMDNILVTDGGTLDATSTIFWSDSYAADDHGYGTNIKGIPVNPGEYIMLYASTTDADCDLGELTTGSEYFDGKIFIEYGYWK